MKQRVLGQGRRREKRGKEEKGLTIYERKQSQPPIHSYEPKTSSHQPFQALYHPFDHLIMELNDRLRKYGVRVYRPERGFGGL
jgi:hypothetical protein